MLNRVILIGRLTRDPEKRSTGSGISVTNFTLAVDRRRSRSSDGNQENATDFIDIVTWRQLADLCAEYLKKGRLVAVEGRLQVRNWQASDGTKRRNAEVVADNVQFLESRKQVEAAEQAAGSSESANPFPPDKDYSNDNDVFKDVDKGDDEDPFSMG